MNRIVLHEPGADPQTHAVFFYAGNKVIFHNISLKLRGKYQLNVHEGATIDGQFVVFDNGATVPLRELSSQEISVEVKHNDSRTRRRPPSFNDFALL